MRALTAALLIAFTAPAAIGDEPYEIVIPGVTYAIEGEARTVIRYRRYFFKSRREAALAARAEINAKKDYSYVPLTIPVLFEIKRPVFMGETYVGN